MKKITNNNCKVRMSITSEDKKEISFQDAQIYQTVSEMMDQRGYTIVKDSMDTLIAEKPDGDKMCVFLNVIEKFNVDEFKICVSRLEELNIPHCIVIYNDITPAAKKAIANTISLHTTADHRALEVEDFLAIDLRVNKTKHRLVPKHEKVPPEQAIKLMNRYPIIKVTDPIAKFYAFKKGDLIKITRSDGYVAYRVVK